MNGNLIYEPKGKALEYSSLACNLYRGCDHHCTYCYAPNAIHSDRCSFGVPQSRGEDFLERLDAEAAKHERNGITGQVLLCFTTDPYQTFAMGPQGVTRQAIQILKRHCFDVCILTKGGSRACIDMDLLGPADAFASTLTFLDNYRSWEWEPGASHPSDRLAAIQEFHRVGIPTWVSLEPVIDPSEALRIIETTATYVDFYKVGRWNYHPDAHKIDWATFAQNAVNLLQSLGKSYLIKKDLAAFLPAGVQAAQGSASSV